MNISIVTPAPPGSRHGNRVTALRWARLLRRLGHSVSVRQQYGGEPCDLLVALHARRSADAVFRFRRQHKRSPLIVALTGTDLYGDLPNDSRARRSLDLATRIIVLQRRALGSLPPLFRHKTRVIHQSLSVPESLRRAVARVSHPLAPTRGRGCDGGTFRVCVLGHLRPVKDPFRAAMATRLLPADSRARIIHLGGALTEAMARRAQREAARNPRWRWLGERRRGEALRFLARSHLLVLSSRMEGGANAVSEALALGVPVISSRIPGSIGLLGEQHPGYFPAGDTRALALLLRRAEMDPRFYARLRAWCSKRGSLFTPAREKRAWRDLLRELARLRS